MGVMHEIFIGTNTIENCLNKTIEKVWLDEETNKLNFKFTDGTGMYLFDDGQCLCERRYMVTADDLTEYINAKLLGVELKEAPNQQDVCVVHEVQFLDIKTDKGVFQMANHNEHDGAYSGFCLVARPV